MLDTSPQQSVRTGGYYMCICHVLKTVVDFNLLHYIGTSPYICVTAHTSAHMHEYKIPPESGVIGCQRTLVPIPSAKDII